jgi:hypothetical protein
MSSQSSVLSAQYSVPSFQRLDFPSSNYLQTLESYYLGDLADGFLLELAQADKEQQ